MNLQDRPARYYRDLAREVLDEYRSGEISFGRMVESLYSHMNSLEDTEWLAEFRGILLTMETVYAVALKGGTVESLPDEDARLVDEAVDELGKLCR